MDSQESTGFTAFRGHQHLATGALATVALAVKAAEAEPIAGQDAGGPILVYDDATGKVVDLDTRGSAETVASRYAAASGEAPPKDALRGRGRPKLGVVPREITLLPRHWEWLSAQPGGASVTLRKLVDAARKQDGGWPNRRAAQDAAYHFMSAMAGDFAHFEDAIRALYAGDRPAFERHIADWPRDIRAHALKLGYGDSGV
jgi:hypothetical protein